VETCSRRDTILYVLGIGFATKPLDEAHLRFLFEYRLLASPTMANTLGFVGLCMADPRYEILWMQMLHAEHQLPCSRPTLSGSNSGGKPRGLSGSGESCAGRTGMWFWTDAKRRSFGGTVPLRRGTPQGEKSMPCPGACVTRFD
jgi:hypothetical protein